MVAFVVFVVSTLLSPSTNLDYASIYYWNALQDLASIIQYDWSEYVVTWLLDAVSKLKQDASSSIKFPNNTGCFLFLQAHRILKIVYPLSSLFSLRIYIYTWLIFNHFQVFYLDNVNFGELSLQHNSQLTRILRHMKGALMFRFLCQSHHL